jgi:hypothetical protein
MMTIERKSSETRRRGSGWSLARRIRCGLIAIVALAAVTSPAATASTTDGGAKNVVIAKAASNGASVPRSSVQVAPVGGDTVGAENLAIAKSTDCRNCHSYATAVQAVLVRSNATTVTPRNAAVANNVACASCSSYAYAYQYVISTGGPARLTTSGQDQVNQIRKQIAAVTASRVGPYEMTMKLDTLTAKFKSVIDHDLVASGGNPHGTTTRNVRLGS